jgi:glycosyltransferase involved in cell wall biosynthesis
MRVGIDAKSFYHGPVSTRIILQNLLPEMIRQNPDIDWIIFLNKKDKSFDFPYKAKNIQLQYVWADVNQVSNVLVLPRYLKKHNVDVVVYQMFSSISSSTPSIVFIHDVLFKDYPEFFTWKERLYFFSMSFLTRKVNRVMTTTNFVASDLIKHNYLLDQSMIDIVPLGVSTEFKSLDKHDPFFIESVKKKLNLPDRFLLFVGRLNVRKNLENLLKAITLIQDKQIPLVVVGKAEWKVPALNKILSEPILKDRIYMIGNISDKDLVAVYALSNIFCFPSFAEGFGLPPLEAMASGIPVIVSNTTSLPEVCGGAATYADPREPHAIAEAINSLLTDPELYNRMKNEGLKRAAQFTWQKTAVAYINSIYKVLQQS